MSSRNTCSDSQASRDTSSAVGHDGIMLELARVVAIPAKQSSQTEVRNRNAAQADENVLWVETLVQSSCGSCSAKSTCGHSILARWFGRKRQCMPVRCRTGEASLLSVGQWVEVGVPESVLLRASLLAYVLPLLGILLGAVLFAQFQWFGNGDASSIIGAALGLLAGMFFSRFASQHFISPEHGPRLIRAVRAPQ